MKEQLRGQLASAATVMALMSGGGVAQAMPVEIDDEWEANWNTTVSVGSTWRAQDPDSMLYKRSDGLRTGLSGGSGGSGSDSNTLNSRAGDRVSTIIKLVTDFEVKHDDMGGLVRLKAWFDQAQAYEDGRYGHMNNGYNSNSPLSDAGFSSSQRFDGAQLLDAYVYNTFDVADHPVQVRLGRQVINWGESLFFQGVNQINPLDLPALRRPGAEIKEAMLPVWAGNASLGLGGGVSLDAFYQFVWEATSVDSCGTYWSTVDIGVGVNPGRCDKIILGSGSSTASITSGAYAPMTEGNEARDSRQFGLSMRLPVDLLDTEIGLYAMNIHSRTPIISARTGSWGNYAGIYRTLYANPMMSLQRALAAAGVKSASGYWEYPEDMQIYGISAATNIAGWSVGSEVSYTPNLPVQRNPSDLLNALLNGKGPMASIAAATGSLSDLRGYDRLQKGQIQVNAIKSFGGILGAAKTTVMGEAMAQVNDAPDYRSGTAIRYGRAFIFGTGSSASENTCTSGANTQADGCQNDGYVTPFAWGYRLRGQLEFPLFLDTPLTFIPSVSIAHDVAGVSADGQLIEDRFQAGIGARFVYERQYTLDFNYVTYGDWAKYDPLRDHDYVSISASMTF